MVMRAGEASQTCPLLKESTESAEMVEKVRILNIDILSIRKQEMWIARYRQQMPNVRLFMALGATVDFEAGTVERCPLWLQRLGMEWFWRFCQEPRRLFRRYFIQDMQFFWYFSKQLLGVYKDPFAFENAGNF